MHQLSMSAVYPVSMSARHPVSIPQVLHLGLEQLGFAGLYLDSNHRMCQDYLGQMPKMSPGLTTVGQYVIKVGRPKVPVHLLHGHTQYSAVHTPCIG